MRARIAFSHNEIDTDCGPACPHYRGEADWCMLFRGWLHGERHPECLTAPECSPQVKINIGQALAADDILHANGRCTCHGEGRCEWCKGICTTCGGDGRAPQCTDGHTPVPLPKPGAEFEWHGGRCVVKLSQNGTVCFTDPDGRNDRWFSRDDWDRNSEWIHPVGAWAEQIAKEKTTAGCTNPPEAVEAGAQAPQCADAPGAGAFMDRNELAKKLRVQYWSRTSAIDEWEDAHPRDREDWRRVADTVIEMLRGASLPKSPALDPEHPYTDRDAMGRIVREVWIAWARQQSNPKPHWLLSYNQLSEQDREVDRRIGERLWRMGFEAGKLANKVPPKPEPRADFVKRVEKVLGAFWNANCEPAEFAPDAARMLGMDATIQRIVYRETEALEAELDKAKDERLFARTETTKLRAERDIALRERDELKVRLGKLGVTYAKDGVEWIPWRKSESDLATDIRQVLTANELAKLIAELAPDGRVSQAKYDDMLAAHDNLLNSFKERGKKLMAATTELERIRISRDAILKIAQTLQEAP